MFSQTPEPAPAPRKKTGILKVGGIVVGAVFLFVLGTAVGGASHADAAPAAAPTPAPTKTVTVTKTVTPASCLDALRYADEGFTDSAEFAGVVVSILKHVQTYDVRGIQNDNSDLSDVNAKITALSPKYLSAKAQCQSGGN